MLETKCKQKVVSLICVGSLIGAAWFIISLRRRAHWKPRAEMHTHTRVRCVVVSGPLCFELERAWRTDGERFREYGMKAGALYYYMQRTDCAHPINYSIAVSYLRTRRLIYFVIVARGIISAFNSFLLWNNWVVKSLYRMSVRKGLMHWRILRLLKFTPQF